MSNERVKDEKDEIYIELTGPQLIGLLVAIKKDVRSYYPDCLPDYPFLRFYQPKVGNFRMKMLLPDDAD